MTTIWDVYNGEEIKALIASHPDVHVYSEDVKKNILSCDDDDLLNIRKHIGYLEEKKSSGIWIMESHLVTEEYIKSIW